MGSVYSEYIQVSQNPVVSSVTPPDEKFVILPQTGYYTYY